MTRTLGITRPHVDEFLPYFGRYIDLVPAGDLLATLRGLVHEVCVALEAIDPAAVARRPALGEWSPLDIAVHLADTERVLAYRAFTFARRDGAELPGVEFEEFAEAADANSRTVNDVVAELRTVRAATVALLGSFHESTWTHRGTASGSTISVRALAYVIAGHDLHHVVDLMAARDSTEARHVGDQGRGSGRKATAMDATAVEPFESH